MFPRTSRRQSPQSAVAVSATAAPSPQINVHTVQGNGSSAGRHTIPKNCGAQGAACIQRRSGSSPCSPMCSPRPSRQHPVSSQPGRLFHQELTRYVPTLPCSPCRQRRAKYDWSHSHDHRRHSHSPLYFRAQKQSRPPRQRRSNQAGNNNTRITPTRNRGPLFKGLPC